MEVSSKRFESPTTPIVESVPESIYIISISAPIGNEELNYPTNFGQPAALKLQRPMKYLAIVQLISAILFVSFGATCFSMNVTHHGLMYFEVSDILGILLGTLCMILGILILFIPCKIIESLPESNYSISISTPIGNEELNYPTNFGQPAGLKLRRPMKYLAIVELILAILFAPIGCTCIRIKLEHGGYKCNEEGLAILLIGVGILCIYSAIIGFGEILFKKSPNQHLTRLYFILSICSAIVCGMLLFHIIASFWVIAVYNVYYESDGSYYYLNNSIIPETLVFNIILVFISFIHLVHNIVTASFICYKWNCCCNSSPEPVIINIQKDQPSEYYCDI